MTPTNSPDAMTDTQPIASSRRGPKTAASQKRHEAQACFAGGVDIPDAGPATEPNSGSRPGPDPAAPPAKVCAVPTFATPAVLLDDPFLYLAAAVLDDTEKVRMGNENRLRILTTPMNHPDANGRGYGFGLTPEHPDVARLAALVQALEQVEKDATKNLERLMRRHPLGAWVRSQPGAGEKQVARLLATIGDPYWNTLHDRPRTVSELWSYCGLRPEQ